MEFELLLENFEVVAEAPGGVDRIREIIINLAISGTLVDQNDCEEPAQLLLERIGGDIADLVTCGVKRGRPPAELIDPVSDVPSGWAWTRIFDLGIVGPSNTAEDSVISGFVPMALVPVQLGESNGHERKSWGEIRKGYTHVADGDVAVAKITPCFQNGKSVVFSNLPNGIGAATTELFVLRPTWEGVDPHYVLLFLKSRKFLDGGIWTMTGTAGQQRIPRDYFSGCPFSLPPLAEQKRIVVKVNELMSLCNGVELRHRERASVAIHARKSALSVMTTSQSPEESSKAWHRVESNWLNLFSEREAIDDVRQSVLDLAFRGKFEEPNEDQTTVTKLLETIRREPGESRFDSEAVGPWSIPTGWRWVPFSDIADCRLGKMLDGAKNSGNWRSYLRNTNVQWFRFELADIAQMRMEDHEVSEFSLRPGDLLICEGGEPGRVAVADETVRGLLFQKALHRARPLGGINPWYLAYFLRSEATSGRLSELFTGATIKHLTGRSLSRLLVPLPPVREQDRIVGKIAGLFDGCENLADALQRRSNSAASFAVGLTLPAATPH